MFSEPDLDHHGGIAGQAIDSYQDDLARDHCNRPQVHHARYSMTTAFIFESPAQRRPTLTNLPVEIEREYRTENTEPPHAQRVAFTLAAAAASAC